MLYIEFNSKNASRFEDFQRLYKHMVNTRQVDYVLAEEDPPEFDWDHMTTEEINVATNELLDLCDQRIIDQKRYQQLIPAYAQRALERYLKIDKDKQGDLGIQETNSLLNYLEVGFEVDFTKLAKKGDTEGRIEFSTGNFPFGGLDRFFMVLKAFDLTPTECFDGFNVFSFEWASTIEYTPILLPKKTKKHIKSRKTKTTNNGLFNRILKLVSRAK